MPGKALWYWNRLLAMSPGEISYRVNLAIKKQFWLRRKLWIPEKPHGVRRMRWEKPELTPEMEKEKTLIIREADRYLAGEFQYFHAPFKEEKPDWHLDNQSGKRAPCAFGPSIDYRDYHVVGNVKNIWEKNR
ncbi:MAG TPA: hypothetical protein VF260_00165, partial [Bacilli bacterium]